MDRYYHFKMLRWRAEEARNAAKRAERKARKRVHSVDAEQKAIEARALADEALAALRGLNQEGSSKP